MRRPFCLRRLSQPAAPQAPRRRRRLALVQHCPLASTQEIMRASPPTAPSAASLPLAPPSVRETSPGPCCSATCSRGKRNRVPCGAGSVRSAPGLAHWAPRTPVPGGDRAQGGFPAPREGERCMGRSADTAPSSPSLDPQLVSVGVNGCLSIAINGARSSAP